MEHKMAQATPVNLIEYQTLGNFDKPGPFRGPDMKAVEFITEGFYDSDPVTYDLPRRMLNVPELIRRGAIFVTYPHGDQGWETDAQEDWQLGLISLMNVEQIPWCKEAPKYRKPASYKKAEQQINSSAPNLGSNKLVYDGKYNQILWSIKKLGIPDNVAFLDKGQQGVAEGRGTGYKEIEFVCANPEFTDATDPKLQKQMYAGLKQIPGVIPLFQDQSDYSEGQHSLTAIYKDRAVRGQILKLAKQLGVQVDLERPVTDDYVDRAIRGEHEGQQGVAEGALSEKINPKTLTRGFVQEKDMGWYTLQAVGDFASRMADEPPTMEIYAMLKPEAGKRDGKQIGQLSLKIAQGGFLKDNPGAEALVAGGVDVDAAYQRKGVASSMYQFAKELGNDVIASIDQSDDAVAMWKGMQAQGVAEGKQPGKSVTDAIQKILPITQEIWFHGSRAIGKHRRNSDTDILVVVPDDVVGDQYLAVVRILQKLSSHFDNYDIQPTKLGTNIHRIAQEEGRLLWSNKQGVAEEKCPHCSGPMFSELMINEKKDACYYKVKSRYKVWPSAYASGALVKCRNKGAANWGNSTKNEGSILEGINRADESLHDWFTKEKWVRMDTKGNIKGPCAKEPGEGKPKCLPQAKAHSLGKKGRASAAARKRREDPNPERSGKAINVATKKKTKG